MNLAICFLAGLLSLTTISAVPRGGNLLANVGPKGDGSLPEQATAAWQKMAAWMQHSRESAIGANAGPWPEKVNAPVTQHPGMAYVHFLPGFTDEVIWKNAPKPTKAVLLRTQEEIPFRYEDGTLHLSLPASARTKDVDVVKLAVSK